MMNQLNFMRFLRAGLAGWAVWEAFASGEWILLLPGGILGLQAIFNVGCCGSTACYAPPGRPDRSTPADEEVVVYEEVKR